MCTVNTSVANPSPKLGDERRGDGPSTAAPQSPVLGLKGDLKTRMTDKYSIYQPIPDDAVTRKNDGCPALLPVQKMFFKDGKIIAVKLQ